MRKILWIPLFLIGLSNLLYASSNDPDFVKNNPAYTEVQQDIKQIKKNLLNITDSNSTKKMEQELNNIWNSTVKSKHFLKAHNEARKILEELLYNSTNSTSYNDTNRDTNSTLVSNSEYKHNYLLFISSSIPLETLKQYARSIQELRQKHIIIKPVLRGFVKGISKIRPTLNWYMCWAVKKPGLFNKKTQLLTNISIDPVISKNIKSVPALYDPLTDCVVYGDASLKFLIQAIKEKRCDQIVGKTYKFAEKNALDQIKEKIKSFNWKKYAEQQKEKIKNKILTELKNYHCMDLPVAKIKKTYYVRPEYTLPFDIPDPRHPGEILYPAGFKFNPLQYGYFPGSIVLLNSSDKRQVKALDSILKKAKPPVRVLLTGGDYLKFNKLIYKKYKENFNIQVYASCQAIKKLIDNYHLCRRGIPCLISVKGPEFFVQEIPIKSD